MREELTQERLKELLHYDPETGVFTWKVTRGRVTAGKAAGSKNTDGYISIGVCGNRTYAHRLAFLYMIGRLPVDRVDHVNQIESDNRWVNLREATMSENLRNVSNWSHNTSGYKGVYPSANGKRYCAKIQHHGDQYNLGTYDCPREAAHTYNCAAIQLHGEFAVLNPI